MFRSIHKATCSALLFRQTLGFCSFKLVPYLRYGINFHTKYSGGIVSLPIPSLLHIKSRFYTTLRNKSIYISHNVRLLCLDRKLDDAFEMYKTSPDSIGASYLIDSLIHYGHPDALELAFEVYSVLVESKNKINSLVVSYLMGLALGCNKPQKVLDLYDQFEKLPIVLDKTCFSFLSQASSMTPTGLSIAKKLVSKFDSLSFKPDKIHCENLLATFSSVDGFNEEIFTLMSYMHNKGFLTPESLTQIIKVCSSDVNALMTFFDRIKDTQLIKKTSVFTSLINSLLKFNSIDVLLDYLKQHLSFAHLVLSLCLMSKRQKQSGYKIFSELSKQPKFQNFARTYLYGASLCTTLEQANQLYDEIIERGFQTNPSIKDQVLKMFVRCGDNARALQLFSQYLEEDPNPPKSYFLEALEACGNLADGKSVEAIEKQITRVYPMDTSLTTQLMNIYIKCNRGSKALEIFHSLPNLKITPTEAIFAQAINACSNIGDVQQAESIYKKVESKMHTGSQNAMIHMYAKNDAEWKALQFYDGMIKNGRLNETTFLGALIACDRLHNYSKAIEIHHQILKNNLGSSEKLKIALLRVYARSDKSQSVEDVEFLGGQNLEDLLSNSSNTKNYARLFMVCGISRDIKQGERIYEKFVESKGILDDTMVNSLMCMYNINYMPKKALEVFHQAQQSKHPILPTRHTIFQLITTHSLLGNFAQAQEIYQENIEKLGEEKSLFALMRIEENQKESSSAIDSFLKMIHEDPHVLKPLYHTAIVNCTRSNNFKKGEEIHKILKANDIEIDSTLAHRLMSMYEKDGQYHKVLEIFSEMHRKGRATLEQCEKALIACGKLGSSWEAFAVHKKVQELNFESSLYKTISNMYNMCKSKRRPPQRKKVISSEKDENKISEIV